MLKLSQLILTRKPLINSTFLTKFFFSTFAIRQVRADYLLIVDDKDSELQYMRQVQTQDGQRGIVLKLEHPSSAYIAMYQPFASGSLLNLKNKNIPWQASVEPISRHILNNNHPGIFDINGTQIYQREAPFHKNTPNTNSHRKLQSLSPILELCYNLQHGDMIQFSGCLGSRKTSTALDIANSFSNQSGSTSIYLNSSSSSETKKAVDTTGSWSLQAGYHKNQTDVGVYMLGIKAIRLAKLLSQSGQNVLLTVDGIRHILQAQWHMIQLLSNTLNKIPGELSFRSPRLPPISILNQIYSKCSQGSEKSKKGSLSAIITTENKTDDELIPEITPYSNNLKHLNSLTKIVNFPLTFKQTSGQKAPIYTQVEDVPSIEQCITDIQIKINEYLIQKKETELKMRLYKSDMKDAPWDYFSLLDAEWWMKGLQSYKVQNKHDFNTLFTWIWLNIHLQLEAHWKIGCLEALQQFQKYAKRQKLQMGIKSLTAFANYSKLEGWFSPFKIDYLP